MVRFAGDFSRGETGSPWPIIPAGVGEECTVIGSSVEVGDIVMAATTKADALLDETAIAGTSSHLRVVEKPDGTVPNIERAGFFGVVTQAADEDEVCLVAWGPCTVQAKVLDSVGKTFLIGEPMSVDFSNATLSDDSISTTKAVAKAAQEATVTTSASLVWVHFDGIYGFGNI